MNAHGGRLKGNIYARQLIADPAETVSRGQLRVYCQFNLPPGAVRDPDMGQFARSSDVQEQVRPGMRVLDLGTGSGILAVAAVKLGAGAVLAIDTDPVAIDVARQNCEHNGVAGAVTVVQGSLDQATDDYDLVVVNILAKVIITLAQEGLAERVRPGGCWMAAGIIETQAVEVVQALQTAGLRVNQRRQLADWVALIGDRMQPA